ncbi:MAG: accessory factor UbiK family protein [Candidatus Competibacterales bacterium]
MAIDPKTIDEITRRFMEAVPPGVRQLQTDMEKNVRAGLQTAFARLDIVTREEFDVQQAVLARTRSRLEELERQVAALEMRLPPVPGAASATPGEPQPSTPSEGT